MQKKGTLFDKKGGDQMKNNLKEKLVSGSKAIGTFFEVGGETAVEGLGYTGLDYIIIDTEHGPFEVESTMGLIRAAELKELVPLVRIKDVSRPSVLKNLDIGAMGLVVPCVETVEEAKSLVEWAKYYPVGKRGFFTARKAGFGYEEFTKNVKEYFQTCNRETLLIPQCETKGCLDNIEEIAALEGVDGIFIGPYDLSIGLGIPAQFDEPIFNEAVARILKACIDNNKLSFILTVNPAMAIGYLEQGFDSVAISTDIAFYIAGIKSMVDGIKNQEGWKW